MNSGLSITCCLWCSWCCAVGEHPHSYPCPVSIPVPIAHHPHSRSSTPSPPIRQGLKAPRSCTGAGHHYSKLRKNAEMEILHPKKVPLTKARLFPDAFGAVSWTAQLCHLIPVVHPFMSLRPAWCCLSFPPPRGITAASPFPPRPPAADRIPIFVQQSAPIHLMRRGRLY